MFEIAWFNGAPCLATRFNTHQFGVRKTLVSSPRLRAVMGSYRLYCLGRKGGFIKAHDLEAATDTDALSQARALKLSAKCELWNGARLVAVLDTREEVRT